MPLIDLSAPIRPDPPELPEPLRTEIAYADHAEGARQIEALFGVRAELLRNGEGRAGMIPALRSTAPQPLIRSTSVRSMERRFR